MRKVIGIGETVLDIIFRDEQPISALPGGSTFNAIISLGRAGVGTRFISETGNDRVGRLITGFLEQNGCPASSVCIYPDSKSPLSLAFLNEKNDADEPPVVVAAEAFNIKAIRWLLKHGADKTATNAVGETARDIVLKNKDVFDWQNVPELL